MKTKRRMGLQVRQPPVLQAHVIGIVQVIDPGQRMAFRQEKLTHLRTNKTGCAGHQEMAHYNLTTFGWFLPRLPRALRVSTMSLASFRIAG